MAIRDRRDPKDPKFHKLPYARAYRDFLHLAVPAVLGSRPCSALISEASS